MSRVAHSIEKATVSCGFGERIWAGEKDAESMQGANCGEWDRSPQLGAHRETYMLNIACFQWGKLLEVCT